MHVRKKKFAMKWSLKKLIYGMYFSDGKKDANIKFSHKTFSVEYSY